MESIIIKNHSAMLDAKSSNQEILLPWLATTQLSQIGNPATGLVIFNLTTKRLGWQLQESGLLIRCLPVNHSGLFPDNSGIQGINHIYQINFPCFSSAPQIGWNRILEILLFLDRHEI